MSQPTETILQLLSADGWSAVYLQPDRSLQADRLVAWALMEGTEDSEEPFRYVVGLVPDDGMATPANEPNNFLGYAEPGEDLASKAWQDKIKDHLEADARIAQIRALKQGQAK